MGYPGHALTVEAGDVLRIRGERVEVYGVRYEHPDSVTDRVVLLTDRGELELSNWDRVTYDELAYDRKRGG